MADYWVSQQRHWCKYCKKYVANNKPSISLHENGRAHKDEVERFLRGVYQKGRQDQEDAENVRREIQRIERAALNSVGLQDRNKYGSTYTTEEKPVRKAVDYYVNPNVPTIEELRQQAQAEKDQTAAVKGREEWAVNKEIAKVGEWEIVEAPAPSITQPSTQKEYKKDEATTHDQKPEFQDDDEDQEDLHSFKIREKEFPADLDIGNEDPADEDTAVTFKKRKLGDTASFKSRKKKPLRKKD